MPHSRDDNDNLARLLKETLFYLPATKPATESVRISTVDDNIVDLDETLPTMIADFTTRVDDDRRMWYITFIIDYADHTDTGYISIEIPPLLPNTNPRQVRTGSARPMISAYAYAA